MLQLYIKFLVFYIQYFRLCFLLRLAQGHANGLKDL